MYYTYILRCDNGTLYTGITTDLSRRFKEHSGQISGGAKYTSVHRPVRFECAWMSRDRASASRLEYRIKRLSKNEKELLIANGTSPLIDLSSYVRVEISENGGMAMDFICYAKCSTCKRAKEFLIENNIAFTERDIKTENPTEEELRSWHKIAAIPLKRFFNTSGMKYKELKLSTHLAMLSEDEQYKLLATDGMLVKRPVLVGKDFVLVGFKQNEWEEHLK